LWRVVGPDVFRLDADRDGWGASATEVAERRSTKRQGESDAAARRGSATRERSTVGLCKRRDHTVWFRMRESIKLAPGVRLNVPCAMSAQRDGGDAYRRRDNS
jgi:hypothetical protein